MKRWYWILSLGIFASFQSGNENLSPIQYIELYKEIAINEMFRTGIPASITMAQGLLESGNGNSRLARQGNNHFGIKCKTSWTGKTIYEDDDAPGECFRAYDSAYLSYIDHSEFLLGNQRYAFLFEYDRTDYKSWANGLKKAGYATNPKYPNLLITIIERHELHKLDHMKPEDLKMKEEPIIARQDSLRDATVVVFNEIPATRVQPGDNIVGLAKRNEMGAWQVRRYNDLPKDQELTPGEILYLKPKKRKGSVPYHVVQPGETMWSISQMYGIKLKHLYRKNHLNRKEDEQPVAGQTLYLQQNNPGLPLKNVEKDSVSNPPIKVVLPSNPEVPGDTITVPEIAPEKHDEPTPKFSNEPAISPEEVKDTLNIPREKEDPSKGISVHTVSPGETLFRIAKQYQVSVEQLKELNGLTSYSIQIGQELIINGRAEEFTQDTIAMVFTHTVKKGETLYSISKQYNLQVEDLKELNKLNSNELSIGQKLKLNAAPKTAPEKAVDELPASHTVEKGDTLYGISRKYNVSVEDLKRLNHLADNAISIGQVLKLK
ncbi:MAG: LysM peptidoglycan-binding domain-containing protein [Bacteroidetes bacterium]|nr:LysM peptidoglycan-binding domain-containing protein [Bacteroidota bacterium]